MGNQDLKDSVLLNLRSVTQSCKGGVPFDRLQKDYVDLLGTPIPFRDLGYNSLEAFIRDIPHVISLRRDRNGQLVAEGVADSSTSHIVSLISKQKSAKKSGRGPPLRMGTRRGAFSRNSPRSSSRNTASHENSYSRNVHSNYDQKYQLPQLKGTRNSTFQVSHAVKSQKLTNSVSEKDIRLSDVSKISDKQKSRQSPINPISNEISFNSHVLNSQKLCANTVSDELSCKSRAPNPQKLLVNITNNKISYNCHALNSQNSVNASNHKPSQPSHVQKLQKSPVNAANNAVSHVSEVQNTRQSLLNDPENCEKAVLLSALQSTKSPKEFINTYAQLNKLYAVYTTLNMGKKNKGFISCLTLGDKKYQSYPDIKPSKKEAEQEVARKAMIAIQEEEQISMLPETPAITSKEIQILMSRIDKIVNDKPSGIFVNGIIKEYEKEFNELLPKNWLDLIKWSNNFDIDALDKSYGKVPEGANFIIRPVKSTSTCHVTSSYTINEANPGYVSANLNGKDVNHRLTDIPSDEFPHIEVPDGSVWDIRISCIDGFLAARLVSYDDQFSHLCDEMKNFYQARNFPVIEVLENKLYVACGSNANDDLCHRVIVVEKIDDDQVQCYFLDKGKFDSIKKQNLQEIDFKFLALPYQAIWICLEGLEDYEEWISHQLLQEHIMDDIFIAEIKESWPAPDFLTQCPGIHRTVYSVILYALGKAEATYFNVNEWLKTTVLKTLDCKLPKISTTACAYLSHITANGQVYIRFADRENCWIEHQLEKLASSFEAACLKSSSLPNTMCVAKYKNKWHRAVISRNPINPELIEVFFVDHGNTNAVKRSEICELRPINELLATFPCQAICCELSDALPHPGAKWTDAATKKLLEIAPLNADIIIRVCDEGDEHNFPKVNLFKRNEDSLIISINYTLACSSELFE